MKNSFIPLVLLLLFSCSKEEILTATKEENTYHLTFEMENESPDSRYLIQVATGQNAFTTEKEVPFDSSQKGNYQSDIRVKKGSQIRVVAKTGEEMTFSPVILVY